jgi:hypothetical protein
MTDKPIKPTPPPIVRMKHGCCVYIVGGAVLLWLAIGSMTCAHPYQPYYFGRLTPYQPPAFAETESPVQTNLLGRVVTLRTTDHRNGFTGEIVIIRQHPITRQLLATVALAGGMATYDVRCLILERKQ